MHREIWTQATKMKNELTLESEVSLELRFLNESPAIPPWAKVLPATW